MTFIEDLVNLAIVAILDIDDYLEVLRNIDSQVDHG
jgi:hypothetical protein